MNSFIIKNEKIGESFSTFSIDYTFISSEMSLLIYTPEDLGNAIISITTNIDALKDIKSILNPFGYGIGFEFNST